MMTELKMNEKMINLPIIKTELRLQIVKDNYISLNQFIVNLS